MLQRCYFAVFLNLSYLSFITREIMLWVLTKHGYFHKIYERASVTRGKHHSNNILYFIIALSGDANGESKSF